MSHERPRQPNRPRPEDEFGLTKEEQVSDRVGHERLLAIFEDEATTVHRIEDSYNNYGEFLFITVTRPGSNGPVWMTFYGAGYHAYRERWITEEWFWYRGNPLPGDLQQEISREGAIEQIQVRLETIAPQVGRQTQSERAKLFEALADLTDEDGAYTEMQDLEEG